MDASEKIISELLMHGCGHRVEVEIHGSLEHGWIKIIGKPECLASAIDYLVSRNIATRDGMDELDSTTSRLLEFDHTAQQEVI